MPASIDLRGLRVGRLVYLRFEEREQHVLSRGWVCQCDCGMQTWVSIQNRKRVESCGCIKVENRYKHGYASYGKTPRRVYRIWRSMKSRCFWKKAAGFKNYGGRGITVCKRWLKFENFLADMGEPPAGTTLDRRNGNGNYCKRNCRWATDQEQYDNAVRKRGKNGRFQRTR